jgi:diguanylate cyclase (GGDEF)-like protein
LNNSYNNKATLFVFVISVFAFFGHRLGLLDTSYSIQLPENHLKVQAISMGVDTAKLKLTENFSSVDCHVTEIEQFNLCGISYILTQDMRKGIDLSIYDRAELKIKTKNLLKESKIKVSFRNFNNNYSKNGDFVSLKFNSITYNPSDYSGKLTVPFSAFQVENWWVKQYKVDFDNSYFDVTNVGYVEIIAQNLPVVGRYQIKISEITLYGERLTEHDLLKIVLMLWLALGIYLLIRHKNSLSILSHTDPLTNIYNQRGIKNYIEEKALSSNKKKSFFLSCIEIENFNKINNSFSHSVGDEVLVSFCKRTKKILEEKLPKRHKISRLSENVICILLESKSKDEIENLNLQFLKRNHRDYIIQQHEVSTSINIGTVDINEEIDTFESMINKTASSLHHAKKRGKNNYQFYNKEITNEIFFQKSIFKSLELAIEENDFSLQFMPIVCAATLITNRVEVLIRGESDVLEKVGPQVFIPIAEQYGLIEKIDYLVIESTFNLLKNSNILNNFPKIIFCINISASELNNFKFSRKLQELLDKYDINPNQIELEITETSLIEIDQKNIDLLKEIKKLGVHLALDDFGTGYTAFNQLINYPVDCLKIDKSFVDQLTINNQPHDTMVKAIISIAKSYKLQTIAEGVETEHQSKILNKLGCDMLQGYYFSKPLSWENFNNYLANDQ